jgi:predicted metal-dependent HD superfamily phosphohydrolase
MGISRLARHYSVVFECRHQPLHLADDVAHALAAAYREPHRAYHNLTHIAELLGWFDRVTDDVGWKAPATVYAAMLFHDAIYVPGAKDNEAKSAEWARRAGFGEDVAALILMTANHTAHANADHDAAHFLDADMAIVGAPAEQFAAYDAAIAKEYGHIPRDAFRAGRKAFLEGVLKLPRIFHTEYFHTRLDAQARANLAAAIKGM